ncbi:hypothetical protein [Paraburkholderia caribensis]|uniref:hypothetical protein n=1 Tax=Paraburkholderia caribensis TaxID=75105 RepID=UPI001D079BC2|nr:hypothetical protein [Paraburkholderia caribensis]
MLASNEKQIAGVLVVLAGAISLMSFMNGGYVLGSVCAAAALWALFSITHIDTQRAQGKD